ncbi:IS2 transposase [Klebsiella pneumoniae subsp. rhinoscleromatis]|nr:IS2 transposase [Klebsiella pneumoniae]STU44972.1 IS2 transposase [Klebsiella pneumoniae]STV43019.1 IS2 transposase [Klebsiella pneumoniae subsp. rhinoscleromatis]VTT32841.1 IS2 transposase [Klebsiella pneumoniae]
MLGAVERRFGNELPASPVEWLTDNGSCYRANETRQFARMLGLEPKNTAVRSPESNGIAESFVKTIKRDYISICQQRVKSDPLTVTTNGLILIHLVYSGLASAITPAFRFCFSR